MVVAVVDTPEAMLGTCKNTEASADQPVDEVDGIDGTITALGDLDSFMFGAGDGQPGGGLDSGEKRQ